MNWLGNLARPPVIYQNRLARTADPRNDNRRKEPPDKLSEPLFTSTLTPLQSVGIVSNDFKGESVFMLQDVLQDLITQLQPATMPAHENFLHSVDVLNALKDDGTITNEEFELLVRNMVAVIVNQHLDSVLGDLFSFRNETVHNQRTGQASSRLRP